MVQDFLHDTRIPNMIQGAFPNRGLLDLPDESPHPPEGETFPVEYHDHFWGVGMFGLYREYRVYIGVR